MASTESGNPKSPKGAHLAWLCATCALDAGLIVAVVLPQFTQYLGSWETFTARLTTSGVTAVVVMILNGVLSPALKARLVFWRWRNPLPGSQAFTKHAAADDRIDIAALRRAIGTFPEAPKAQNALWYAMYDRVRTDERVLDSHKNFLLFRDISALSTIFLFLSVALMAWLHRPLEEFMRIAAIFVVQYLVVMLAARHAGVRLVKHVLTIYASGAVQFTAPIKILER
jgi:hypothetical protein